MGESNLNPEGSSAAESDRNNPPWREAAEKAFWNPEEHKQEVDEEQQGGTFERDPAIDAQIKALERKAALEKVRRDLEKIRRERGTAA